MLTLGPFPEVSLADATEKRDEARKLLAKGINPSQQRKEEKRAVAIASKNSFGAVEQDYTQKMRDEGRTEKSIFKVKWHVDEQKDIEQWERGNAKDAAALMKPADETCCRSDPSLRV